MADRPFGSWQDGEVVSAAVQAMLERSYQAGFAGGLRAGMGTCGTCRHWTAAPAGDRWLEAKGQCAVLTDDADYGANRTIYVKVAYGYSVEHIYTAADFGCVLHEARPSEDEVIRDSDH